MVAQSLSLGRAEMIAKNTLDWLSKKYLGRGRPGRSQNQDVAKDYLRIGTRTTGNLKVGPASPPKEISPHD